MKQSRLFLGIIALSLMFVFNVSEVFAFDVTLKLQTSDGAPLENGIARYKIGNTVLYFGSPYTTDASGEVSMNLSAGTYSFNMQYDGTSEWKNDVIISGDTEIIFTTTTVTLQYSGRIRYGGPSGVTSWFKSSIATSTATKELLAGTYKFKADPGNAFDLTISGDNMEKTLTLLKLEDHVGDGFSGGKAKGGYSSPSLWYVAGVTASNGYLTDIRNGLITNLVYQMNVNNGNQTVGPQDVTTNSVFVFQTELVTLRLEKCDGTPLDGGKPRFGSGASYWTSWWPNGNTGSSAPGETNAELFAGTYSFDMLYKGTSDQKNSETVPDGGATFTWQTTEVTLGYSGVISYGGSGDARYFDKPTMDLLPGTYTFNFRSPNGNTYTDLTFSGCSFTGAFLSLVDELGNPLANYPADYPGETRNLKMKHRCGGSWSAWTSLQTDANGHIWYDVNCSNWDKKITMVLNQTTLEQDITVNSTFQAAKVNVNLNTCSPASPLSGGTVEQGGGYWYTHGVSDLTGTVPIYAFPGNNVKIRMNYNYSSQTQNSVAVMFPVTEVDFTTTTVNFNYAGTIQIQTGGWPTISSPIELLPGIYGFKFDGNYVGGVNINGCQHNFAYLTVLDEFGNGVPGAKFTPACGGSWQAQLAGSTDANGHLFAEIPSCMTKIEAIVNQTSQQKSATQLLASNYTYTAELLRINLLDHTGAAITDQNGTLEQGGGHWYNWGNFNSSGFIEVPAFSGNNVKFSATYNCTSDTKSGITVNAGVGAQNIDFQTGQVISSCGHTQYQGCGWSTFTSGMELMPGTREYRYPAITANLTAGAILDLCSAPKSSTVNMDSQSDELSSMNMVLYPNPVRGNNTATLQYSLDQAEKVQVSVYNSIGLKIQNLEDAIKEEGKHSIQLSTENMNPGIYHIRIVINKQQFVKSLLVR